MGQLPYGDRDRNQGRHPPTFWRLLCDLIAWIVCRGTDTHVDVTVLYHL